MDFQRALRWRDLADQQGMAACLTAIRRESLDVSDAEATALVATFRRFREAMLTSAQARELRSLIASPFGRQPLEPHPESAALELLRERRRELERLLEEESRTDREKVELAEKLRGLTERRRQLAAAIGKLRGDLAAERELALSLSHCGPREDR